MEEENIPQSKEEADADMTQCLESRSRYSYPYDEFMTTWLLMKLCCCFKRRPCYKRRQKRYYRHEVARAQLAKETDFFKFLKLLRVTDFLSKNVMRKY